MGFVHVNITKQIEQEKKILRNSIKHGKKRSVHGMKQDFLPWFHCI